VKITGSQGRTVGRIEKNNSEVNTPL
jgi:hypothetical protein